MESMRYDLQSLTPNRGSTAWEVLKWSSGGEDPSVCLGFDEDVVNQVARLGVNIS